MWRVVVRLVVVMLPAALLSPSVASACGELRHSHAVERQPRLSRAPVLIGDSTSIIAAPILGRLGMEADAHGCRQFGQGVQLVAARRRAHTLPHVVALALGANGPVSAAQVSAAVRITGRHRVLALVTPKNSGTTIASMRRAARRYPDRVLVIDWARYSAGHGSWFAGDGLHVGQEGARAYARLIRRSVAPFAFPPSRTLKVGRPAAARKRCGVVRRGRHPLRVYVLRGERRILCARARTLVRRPPLRRIAGWRTYDWRATRSGTWSWVYARRDRKVLVGALPGN